MIDKEKVYIIAEMSANHCGSLDNAIEIVRQAKKAGADAVKIQTYTADTMTIDCRSDIFMAPDTSPWRGINSYDLYKMAQTPWEWYETLKQVAKEVGVDLFSTPFDKTAVDFLEEHNCPIYKIASFEAVDIPFIKYCASKMKPMIISTGICTQEEIKEAIDACYSVGNYNVSILKCTSSYPAKLDTMNLLTIKDMKEKFKVNVGISDHTIELETPIVAVSLGAKIIEKHFTLDRSLGGADCEFSLNPNEFSQMVQSVRKTEELMGEVNYKYNENSRKHARSLFAVKDIKKGEKFTPENVRSIRPNYGLHPRYYEKVIGKVAKCDISFGTPLNFTFLNNNNEG